MERTREALGELIGRQLGDLRLAVMMLDGAPMRVLTASFIDSDEARRQNEQRHVVGLAMARQQVIDAEAEVARAKTRLDCVRRAFQDGHLYPADYAEQRTQLVSEKDGAEAAARQAPSRLEEVKAAGGER